VRQLNSLYLKEPSLHEEDNSWEGFSWIDLHDAQRSILSFARHSPSTGESILVACNFTPVVRHDYRLGVMMPGDYQEILNSDQPRFGGSGNVNTQAMSSSPVLWHSQPESITLTLPPLSVVFIKKISR